MFFFGLYWQMVACTGNGTKNLHSLKVLTKNHKHYTCTKKASVLACTFERIVANIYRYC